MVRVTPLTRCSLCAYCGGCINHGGCGCVREQEWYRYCQLCRKTVKGKELAGCDGAGHPVINASRLKWVSYRSRSPLVELGSPGGGS